MAVTLMTTTGTLADVQAALGMPQVPGEPTQAGDPVSASMEARPEADAAVPVVTPEEPVVAAPADEAVPDSEFDEDGEPTTERAARSSHTKLQTIKKLRIRAREAEHRAAHLEGQLEVLKSVGRVPEPPQASSSQPPAMVTSGAKKPAIDDTHPETGELLYQTQEDYLEALTDWKLDVRETQRLAREAEAQARQHAQTADSVLRDRITTFATAHPDYDDVVSDPTLLISDVQAQILHDPDNAEGPAMAYALAKDKALCESIRLMAPGKAILAMGRLQASVMGTTAPTPAPPAPKPAPARPMASVPPPPTLLRGTAAPASTTLDALAKAGDFQGFRAARDAAEALQRQRR